MIKFILKLFKKEHQHKMIIERYRYETCSGTGTYSRMVCNKCGWVDFESPWTNIEKPYWIK
jgi:hypothetical protein